MGIDIYMRWKGQSESEEKSQYTGFSVTSGAVGYLREAYHGKIYATKILVPEAFESEHFEAKISASVLEARLPEALLAVKERARKTYNTEIQDDNERLKAFRDFVELAKKKESELGEPVTIYASY